jgi:hypothetical protein
MIMLAACSPRCPKARHLGHPSFVGELTTPPAREYKALRLYWTVSSMSQSLILLCWGFVFMETVDGNVQVCGQGDAPVQ